MQWSVEYFDVVYVNLKVVDIRKLCYPESEYQSV